MLNSYYIFIINKNFKSILDFIDNEREPLLRGVTSESRQYTNNEHAGTFFTPMDSPDHSDHEDENTRPSSSRGFLKTNEAFPSKPLPKLTSEMVNKCVMLYI